MKNVNTEAERNVTLPVLNYRWTWFKGMGITALVLSSLEIDSVHSGILACMVISEMFTWESWHLPVKGKNNTAGKPCAMIRWSVSR